MTDSDSSLQILIVDDQQAVRGALELLFDVHDLRTLSANGPERALALIRSENIGVVVQDMNFAEGETGGSAGLALFRAIRQLDPDLPVLLMTAWTSLETAVELMREGAADYFAKPWDDDKLLASVKTLLRMRELAYDNTRLRSRGQRARRSIAEQHDLRGLVYASDAMHELVSLAVKVAPSDAPVLITGPNGAGKERIAELVQANSRRSKQPFIKVNAGGLADTLLEAELFGAEAGAFTGASKLRIGRFEAAHGGTIFLDELGNLSPNGQMKLLRVLQSGEFERVGSSTTRKVDVRVISATNVDLPRAIKAGTFREDLYFRLNVIELSVPPLAERPDDVLPLSARLLTDLGPALKLAPEARDALLAYEWPGNVRELQNRLQRASLVCSDSLIRAQDLGLAQPARAARPPAVSGSDSSATAAAARAPAAGADGRRSQPAADGGTPPPRIDPSEPNAERDQIQEALQRAQGVVSKAAAELGVSRQALYRRMERLGLSIERRILD
jgi:DNA-binding NtrC family response regulator